VRHVQPGHTLDGFDQVLSQVEVGEGGKLNMGDALQYGLPFVANCISSNLHRYRLRAFHWVVWRTWVVTYSVHLP
jgi:hypothetical protein